APTMVATAVHEQQRRLVRVAPVDEVELQSLRVEIVRRRAEDASRSTIGVGLARATRFAECRGPVAGSRPMRGPLDGIRVLELGIWVAVPSAAAVLADWGADVVKIEPPDGDPLRGLAATGLVPFQPDINPAFQLDNRGKRGIVCDLRHAEGQALAQSLAARADVFVTNLRRRKLA